MRRRLRLEGAKNEKKKSNRVYRKVIKSTENEKNAMCNFLRLITSSDSDSDLGLS